MDRFYLVFLIFACFVSAIIGRIVGESIVKEQAIEHNAAKYVLINEKTKDVEFKWIDEIEDVSVEK
jgi:hypothetical protein